MTEQDCPEPQRSIETTLALHNVIAAVSERISEKGSTMYEGSFNTKITHGAIFPTSNCQGTFIMTFVENLVQFADFKCSEGCEYEEEYYMAREPEKIMKQKRSTYIIRFGEVGFITDGLEDAGTSDNPGVYVNEKILDDLSNFNQPITDDDIRDLMQAD